MRDPESLAEEFFCSETMKNELKQCLKYVHITGIDVDAICRKLMSSGVLPCRDKKAGKEALKSFREALAESDYSCGDTPGKRANTLDTGLLYIEEGIRNHPQTARIISRFPDAEIRWIHSYKDVYYHPDSKGNSNGNNNTNTNLILAEKTGTAVLPGAPVCQDFDERYFYYTSSATGCLFDCEYCYLKGMYLSRDLLVYVNLEDTFREVEELLREHEVYLCLSYDTDLAVIEDITGYVGRWSAFVQAHPGLLAECRTKCARTDLWERLTPCDRMIFAFTISPDEVIDRFEHRTPSLEARLVCAKTAMERGFPVRLCFDPMLRIPGWREAYMRMLEQVAGELDLTRVRDVSVGTFRISQDYLKRLRQAEPMSAAVQFPFINEGGVYGYTALQRREMTELVTGELRRRVPQIRIDCME